ncbi:MAG TPA: alpha/beta hydrolase [Acidimicrobiales bacterium]|nr:alpha/beta hydrolase [Acidimicrobiales bacterium]
MFRGGRLLASGMHLLPLAAGTTDVLPVRERSCRVEGRRFGYGEVVGCGAEGEAGPTVVLVHGWGVAHSSYKRAARELAGHGFRVLVPDLPGFGRSSDLRLDRVNLESFAKSLRGFLLKVQELHELPAAPVHVVGHSFGGAVSARLAHDAPECVASLVLVDAATGATWSRHEDSERTLAERPLWDWALHLLHEFPLSEFPSAATSVLRDLGHNLVWHLPSLGLAAHITVRSDIRAELKLVSELGIPISVVWAEGDRVVTKACFDDQCIAVGCEGTVVSGNHGWPFADPVAFGRVVASHLRLLAAS